MKLIKVGICVAYDWYFLANSIPLIYEYADKICISLDKNRTSWAGSKFKFDELGFRSLLSQIDSENKIDLYEADFHIPDLTPMENETRQRNLMAEKLGLDGSWHIQIDADEYFVDFKGFTEYLGNFKSKRPINILCPLLTMYKEIKNGYLIIPSGNFKQTEYFPIATNLPKYDYARRNGHFNHFTNYFVLHQSFARNEREIFQKINNWGHKNDFNLTKYFEKWKSLDDSNYESFINFHPLDPKTWRKLVKVESKSINDLVQKYRDDKSYFISDNTLKVNNSIWFSRAKALLAKLNIL